MIPERDAVVAITANTGDMQKELNVVWDKLLLALHDEKLPENPDELEKLRATLGNLSVSRK